MAQNYSLQQNVQQAYEAADPFAIARQGLTKSVGEAEVMNNPFPDMPVGSAAPAVAAGSTLQQAASPAAKPLPFPDLAKQYGLDVKGLSKVPDLGRLQLLKRVQEKLGPDFSNKPEFGQLMKAWDEFAQGQDSRLDEKELASQGSRTLQALFGGAG